MVEGKALRCIAIYFLFLVVFVVDLLMRARKMVIAAPAQDSMTDVDLRNTRENQAHCVPSANCAMRWRSGLHV
jgi:hypothetical protein